MTVTHPARQTIVVGVSGSPASAAALRWAAEEARRRHAALHVVNCWNTEPRAYYAPLPGQPTGGEHEHARQLAAIVREVLDGAPPPGLAADAVEGAAERTLVEESASADLLVLGSAAAGLADHAVGPVIRACLSHAHCPVVVVG